MQGGLETGGKGRGKGEEGSQTIYHREGLLELEKMLFEGNGEKGGM